MCVYVRACVIHTYAPNELVVGCTYVHTNVNTHTVPMYTHCTHVHTLYPCTHTTHRYMGTYTSTYKTHVLTDLENEDRSQEEVHEAHQKQHADPREQCPYRRTQEHIMHRPTRSDGLSDHMGIT